MTPITKEKLRELFDKLKKDGEVPYDFPVKCCQTRAHRMADTAKGEGVECRKICATPLAGQAPIRPTGRDGNPMTFPPGGAPVGWTYHVAVVVTVTKDDGTTVDMVLDPSLSDEPMTVPEWLARLGGPTKVEANLYPPNVYNRDCDGAHTQTVVEPDSEEGRTKVKDKLAAHKKERDAALKVKSELPQLPRDMRCIRPRLFSVKAGAEFAEITGDVLVGAKAGTGPFKVPAGSQDEIAWLAAQVRDRRLVALQLAPKSRLVVGAYAPSRLAPRSIRASEDGVAVVTEEPSPFVLRRKHAQFAALRRRLEQAIERGGLLDFVTSPGRMTIVDLFPAPGAPPKKSRRARRR